LPFSFDLGDDQNGISKDVSRDMGYTIEYKMVKNDVKITNR